MTKKRDPRAKNKCAQYDEQWVLKSLCSKTPFFANLRQVQILRTIHKEIPIIFNTCFFRSNKLGSVCFPFINVYCIRGSFVDNNFMFNPQEMIKIKEPIEH